MKHFNLLPLLLGGFCLAAPVTGLAKHKVTVYRDLDRDGHYNKKTYDLRDHYRHGHYGHRRYYGYGGGYYGYGYPYYGRSYYGYPYSYGYPRASFGFSYSPSYYSSYGSPYYARVYRGRAVGSYSDDLAVDVQSALKRRGYYRGPLDGDIGPGSRAAIRAYQADRGLAVTGRIDSSLLRALGIS